jgi:hypothetical protein
MASVDDLPADQRAVLQMVLQRGRTYDEIANLLSIDRSAVRQRALDASDALTPVGMLQGPEQALVTDYLLSQLPEQVAEQVFIYLETARDDREWASAIAGHLTPLASSPLPEIPGAAGHSPIPAAHTTADARAAGSGSRRAEPRRRDTMLVAFVSAAALITVVVMVAVVVLVSSGGSSSGSSSSKPRRIYTYTGSARKTATQTGSGTTTTNSEPQILAALNLTSPVGATQTIGVAQVVRDDGVVGIVIDAQGVPRNSAHNAYGLWLYNSAKSHRFVGFIPNLVGKNGKLATEGELPTDASDFKRLLITLETKRHPKTPGEVVLSGPFREK